MKKTLIVAFDGLDKELIEKFGLENIKQQEYGKIDNKTGIYLISTSELFASFITGETREKHGISGLAKWTNPKVDWFENNVGEVSLFKRFYGLRKAIYESLNFLNAKKKRYTKEDIKCPTIFEKIENSRAMYIPSYNPSWFWLSDCETRPLNYGASVGETANFWDEREFHFRKRQFMHELESDIVSPRDLLMVHFHRPDIHHHLYGDERLPSYDEEKLRKLYRETDKFAAEIKEKALEKGYERIIFMSDHGLPTETEHNENAFYSSNKELFGNKIPKITDFYDKL